MTKMTVATVNAALKAAGFPERLTRGDGYFYFRGGTAARWHDSSVAVYRVDAMTVPEWVECCRERRTNVTAAAMVDRRPFLR